MKGKLVLPGRDGKGRREAAGGEGSDDMLIKKKKKELAPTT